MGALSYDILCFIKSMHYFSNLIPAFSNLLVHGGYSILSIIVILEGLPLIGSLFPGHVAIIFAGFLAKLGILNLGAVLLVVIVSAALGDIVGFLLGRRYGYAFLQRFGRYIFLKQEYIEKAKKVIDAHTGKTIILGKLSPVTRPLMPFLVGASGVHIKTFWFYNLIGGTLWAVLSVMLGYIFGATYHVAAQYFGKFMVLAIILTLLIIWGYRFVNRSFHVFRKYELFVLGLNLVSLWALFKTMQDGLSKASFMANFDVYVNIFVAKSVGPFLTQVASWTSIIGGTVVMIALGLIIGVAFAIKKKWRRSAIVLSSIATSAVVVSFLKELFMRVRPDNAIELLSDPSFPSGHATLSAAFFVSIVYITAPHIRSLMKREVFIVLCVLIVIAIGVSRVVLNVHWASDVIAGWALGVFLSTSSILLVRYVSVLFQRKA